MIKLIATDMDGTLLNGKKELPPHFYEDIAALRQKGVRFCIASGRTWGTLKENFAGHLQEMDFICENGAFVMENGQHTFENIVQKNLTHEVLETLQSIWHKDLCVALCTRQGVFLTPFAHNERLRRHMANSVVELREDSFMSLEQMIEDVPGDVFKISMLDVSDPQRILLPRLREHFGARVCLIHSGKYFADCMNAGVSKGGALHYMQKSLHILPEETMAFGDYFNDVEMLACAKYSFVMENAPQEMRAHGNFVAPCNEEAGVMQTVRRYVLEEEPLP